jgi:large repetitive protein
VNGVGATSVNSTIATVGVWQSGITLNTTTGAISVAIGTTPGTYNLTYRLCDNLSPQNCANVVDVVTVKGDIRAITESGTVTSLTGGTAIANIRSNDFVNGVAAASANSTIAVSGTWQSGITLNTTTGAVSVVAGTAPGTYLITYQLCDLATPTPNCDTAVDTVYVTGAIIAVADKTNINAVCGTQSATTYNVLTNDSNPGGSAIRLTAVSTPSSGSVTFTSTGTVSYTPVEGYTGLQVMTYTVCDLTTPTNQCTNSYFIVSIGSGTFPAPVNDAVTINEDNIAIISVLSNDGSGLTLVGVPAPPTNGKVSVNTNGTLTYIPNADFAGTDTFCYSVRNAAGLYSVAAVTVTIVNDACDSGTMAN